MCWRCAATALAVLVMAVACVLAQSGSGAPPSRTAQSPRSLRELPTTDAGIALGNLSSQITGLEEALATNHLTGRRLGELVELLLARGQLSTRVGDFERAELIAERFVREHPDDADAYHARAQTRSAFHRFAEASADLDQATRLAGDTSPIRATRATVLQATGRYDEALAIRQQAATAFPNTLTLGAQAAVLAERGDIEQAERLFVAAQDAYRDVSPFPLSWIYSQQGLMWMRAGNLQRARELLEAAHQRLPQDTVIADHLGWLTATLGDRDQAVELLRTAAEADDPAAAADLARVLQYAGQPAEAERWRVRAAARYEDLLQRHPQAFLNHAALFWLGAGGDARRALALARQQVEIQTTPISYALLLQAALAAGEPAVGCEAAAGVLSFGRPTPYDSPLGDRSVAERVAKSCVTPTP
jgi:tetratricopeptide (TPR) repeat protein